VPPQTPAHPHVYSNGHICLGASTSDRDRGRWVGAALLFGWWAGRGGWGSVVLSYWHPANGQLPTHQSTHPPIHPSIHPQTSSMTATMAAGAPHSQSTRWAAALRHQTAPRAPRYCALSGRACCRCACLCPLEPLSAHRQSATNTPTPIPHNTHMHAHNNPGLPLSALHACLQHREAAAAGRHRLLQ